MFTRICAEERGKMQRLNRHFFFKFFLLFLFWLLLSGKYDPFHITLGVLSSILIAWMHKNQEELPAFSFGFWLRLLLYVPWILWRILLANFHTAVLILKPKLPIQPHILNYHTTLQVEEARVLLALSITLTPGTITTDLAGNVLTIHALDEASTSDLTSGLLEKKIGWVFQDKNLAAQKT